MTTVVLILVMGFFAPRWLGPRRCINSSLVEEITIQIIGGEPLTVQACTPFTRSFGPDMPDWFNGAQVIERIETLESLSRFWPTPDSPLKLLITQGSTAGLAFREDSIEIGPDYLVTRGVLERSLMGYWIGLRDSVSTQVATDLLWNILKSEATSFKNNPSVSAWTDHLVSLRAYCGLGLNVLHHEEFCHVQRELGEGLVVGQMEGSATESPVFWSIHQLITKALSQVFVNLPLNQKSSFLEKLVFLNHFEDDDTWSDITRAKSLQQIDQQMIDHVMHITSSLGIDTNALWTAIKPSLLTKSNRSVRYFVMGPDITWSVRDLKSGDTENSVVAIEQGASKYLYPSDVPLRVSRQNIFDSLKVDSVTIVGCNTPKPSRILEFDPVVRKVLFVKMCNGDEFQLSDLLTLDQDRLVQNNKNIEFVEFNLAAVRFAVKTKGTLQTSSQISDWQKWLDWQGSSFDPERSAYRPHAAIDGINWFRTN